MIQEELNARFAPIPADGETLPENGRMPEGSFFLLRKGVLRLLFLYKGGERLLVATLPAMLKMLPSVEGLPEMTRVVVDTGTALEEWIVIDGNWTKF